MIKAPSGSPCKNELRLISYFKYLFWIWFVEDKSRKIRFIINKLTTEIIKIYYYLNDSYIF